ncbi:MAG TPA: hypothetical protein VMB91_12355 [Solirubrobacteraceae bacterium]|nr:hypothetical protein [Solirubrobacteraceae bacterium]
MSRDRRCSTRRRGTGRRLTLLAGLAAGLAALIMAAAPFASGKGSKASPQDRASSLAFLRAELAYTRARVASAPATLAAVQSLKGSLEGQCAGVMDGAPHETLGGLLAPRRPKLTPRQEGEEKRHERQWSALNSELSWAVGVTELSASHEAALAFVEAIRQLRWSEPSLTRLTTVLAETLELEVNGTVPAVCADMQAWVSSEYRTLTTATKALERSDEETLSHLFAALLSLKGPTSVSPVNHFQSTQEKQLEAALQAAEAQDSTKEAAVEHTVQQLQVGLGLQTQGEREAIEKPHKGAVEIGHGRTLTHTKFKVYVEPPQAEPGPLGATECVHPIAIWEPFGSGKSSERFELPVGPVEGCLSAGHPAHSCQGSTIALELRTVPAARRVRLTLSNGRQVTSKVFRIPRRLGGPGGVYYQALKGPSPTPVRLEELGAHGRVLRAFGLALPHCPRPPAKRPVRHTRTLVNAKLSGGTPFSIRGISTRLGRHKSFELRAEVSTEPFSLLNLFASEEGVLGSRRAQRTFATQVDKGCRPSEFAIVYGVLHVPRDAVLARTPAGLVALQHVRIPPGLHAHGVLAYIALPSVPEELVVRTPAGRTVATISLASTARAAREVCEGEAEP